MTPPVCHILITILEDSRLQASSLVFKSLRVGFPKAKIVVWGNALDVNHEKIIIQLCNAVSAQYVPVKKVSHGEFIERLLFKEEKPFWICDGDVIFFDNVENWFDEYSPDLFAGRYEPEFWEAWTETRHMARLHPSLMFFNTPKLRAAMRNWPNKHPFFRSVEVEFVKWHFVPRLKDGAQELMFYDTTAGLHHAFGGTQFTEKQNRRFAHLFQGTYANLVDSETNLVEVHKRILANPILARSLWQEQQKWYAANRC